MTKTQRKYWLTESGSLTTTVSNVTMANAEEISRSKFFQIKKEREEERIKLQSIEAEVAKNGCYIDEEDNVWI